MARLSVPKFALLSTQLRYKVQVRRISATRRLLSQEWQQEGIPGSNIPFCIKNKYLFTLKCYLFFASGFLAPYLIMLMTLNRVYGPQEPPPQAQQLTTIICTDVAKTG